MRQSFHGRVGRGRQRGATLAAGLVIAIVGVAGTLDLAPPSLPPSLSDLTIPDPMPAVRQLCSSSFAGRKAGTPGADRAAEWLVSEFWRLGLQPAPGASGFRQAFTMPVSLLASPWDRKARLTGPAGSTTFIEYPCFRGSGFSEEAEAIFAGAGIARRDQGWDDYQGRNVRGKYVIYWDGTPAAGIDREEHARWRDARARGAIGCLVLTREPDAAPAGLESPIRDFPVLRLDATTARRLLGGPPPPPPSSRGPHHSTARRIRIDIPPAEDPARPAANIIGMIPGADPAVAGEVIILSAHYDHLGSAGGGRRTVDGSQQVRGGSKVNSSRGKTARHLLSSTAYRPQSTIYPGADDDASGVAVVLGAARTLRQAGARPRRTILFCLWTAEECGLLGSQEYVDHPLVPLAATHFVLQVEMVGAGDPERFLTSAANLSGSGYDAMRAAADDLHLTLAADTCRGISDHMPFIRRGIPALVVTTTGDHPNYHTSRDTPQTLRPAGIENATRLCIRTIWREANE